MTFKDLNQHLQQFRSQSEMDGISKYCVGVLPIREGKVALVRRVPDDFLGGYWELAGGGVENGEDLLQTLVRETREELGVQILSFGLILPSFDYQTAKGKSVRQFNITIEIGDQKIQLNPKEHDDIVWLPLQNLFHHAQENSISLTNEIKSVLGFLVR